MNLSLEEVIANNIKTYIECFEPGKEDDGKLNYLCRIDGCHKTYSDKSSCIRHLRKKHKEVYDSIKSEKQEENVNQTNSSYSFEIRVKVNPDDILDACAELITANGLPLSAVEYPAFKRLLNPYVTALKMKGINLSINKKSIKKHIVSRTNEVKKIIRSETRNKMISLMIDIATRYNRSVLGISIAYMFDGQICVRTIGMHILKSSHTGSYISDVIKQTLLDYNICVGQILSITTDNGKNVTKAIALLDAYYQNQKSTENKNRVSQPGDSDDEDDYYIDPDIFDEEYYNDLLDEVKNSFVFTCPSDLIHGVACACHCINLVVKHAVKKTPEAVRIIDQFREIAKLLRKPTLRSRLKAANMNMAILDVETRWNSIYSMVITKCLVFFHVSYSHKMLSL